MRFDDRRDAGRRLGERLVGAHLEAPVVLGLPRGGVPVAAEVAAALQAPLDVLVARKVGAPLQPELGIGAIAEGLDRVVLNPEAGGLVDAAQLAGLVAREQAELERRVQRYRGGRPLTSLEGHDVVVVDDGLATGVTAEAALLAVRRTTPARLWLAAPVCAPATVERLRDRADAVVCVLCPAGLGAIGAWYEDFTQTTDEEVVAALHASAELRGSPAPRDDGENQT